jgi:enoyl-CoA hydratase/carnithine racemase
MGFEFPDNDRVSVTVGTNGVAQVRLTRPDKLNALDREMFDRLIEAGHALREAQGLRAVVLSGQGRGFCSGIDLASIAGGPDPQSSGLAERTHGDYNRFQLVAMQWRDLAVPVIAAVHGACMGAGLQLASGADIRVVAPDAQLAIMEMRWGIIPDMAGYVAWRELVRGDVLRELIYTNRVISGEEAQALGLATLIDSDPLKRATALAEEIAGRSPHAIRHAKRLANLAHDASIAEILLAESRAQQELVYSRNQLEAVMSQLQHRPPKFEDP